MHTPLLNWNLKGNRFGASIKFELNRSSNLYFPKGGDSLPFVVSSSIHAQGPRPPPSREIGFPFRFPRFKSSRRDRGRGISRVTERTQEWHIDPEKGTRRCPLPPSFSLSLPLSPTIDRSIPLGGIVIPHFRSCTRKFPLHQTSPDSWNSCPHGHRTSNIEYTASERSFSLSRERNLFLFRPSRERGYFSTEISIPRNLPQRLR